MLNGKTTRNITACLWSRKKSFWRSFQGLAFPSNPNGKPFCGRLCGTESFTLFVEQSPSSQHAAESSCLMFLHLYKDKGYFIEMLNNRLDGTSRMIWSNLSWPWPIWLSALSSQILKVFNAGESTTSLGRLLWLFSLTTYFQDVFLKMFRHCVWMHKYTTLGFFVLW